MQQNPKEDNKNILFKDFDTFKNRINATYKNTIVEQDFKNLQQLERKNDVLVLGGGNGTFLFKNSESENFKLFTLTDKGSNTKELNHQEAKSISEKHYHISSFTEFAKKNEKKEIENKPKNQEAIKEKKPFKPKEKVKSKDIER